MTVLWFVCIALLLAVIVFGIKICVMRKSIREICEQMEEHAVSHTNRSVNVSSNDRYVRTLAIRLEKELSVLRHLRRTYEQGDRELKEAVINISHDLRTPLTAILGYVELLERERKSDTVERYLLQIKGRIDVMNSLTEELFRYSVLAGESDLIMKRLNLCHSLEDSLIAFYGVMKQKGIEPKICMPEHAVWCTLDGSALSRIFENIIFNTVRYSDGDFFVDMTEDGEIAFSNHADKLSKVEVERLFDRFYTVDSAHKSTGLGLSIAKLLTERMGGQIAAEYEDERLVIRLWFPIE